MLATGWKLVRRTKSTTNWHQATDWLTGTSTYCSAVECSVDFEGAVSGYDQILLCTGDLTKCMVLLRSVVSALANTDCWTV